MPESRVVETPCKVVSKSWRKPGHENKVLRYFLWLSLFGRNSSYSVNNRVLCEGGLWEPLTMSSDEHTADLLFCPSGHCIGSRSGETAMDFTSVALASAM